MNKAELIKSVSEQSGLSRKQAEAAVSAVLDTIAEELKNGGRVQLTGFGTFEVRERAARTTRVPGTDRTVEVPASRTPAFKAGKALKDAVEE